MKETVLWEELLPKEFEELGATLKLVLRVLLPPGRTRAKRVCPWHPEP